MQALPSEYVKKIATEKRVFQHPKVTYTCEPNDIQDNKKKNEEKILLPIQILELYWCVIIFQQQNIKTVLCPFETVKLKICGLLDYFVLQG